MQAYTPESSRVFDNNSNSKCYMDAITVFYPNSYSIKNTQTAAIPMEVPTLQPSLNQHTIDPQKWEPGTPDPAWPLGLGCGPGLPMAFLFLAQLCQEGGFGWSGLGGWTCHGLLSHISSWIISYFMPFYHLTGSAFSIPAPGVSQRMWSCYKFICAFSPQSPKIFHQDCCRPQLSCKPPL